VNQLPHFRLIKNPYEIGSFIKTTCRCDCCERIVDYIYTGPIFSSSDSFPEDLCANCIMSGKAHERFNVTFNDSKTQLPLSDDPIASEIVREFAERTPGLADEESLVWPTHCHDICALVNASSDLKQYKRLPLLQKESLEPYETVKHFTFECLHCQEIQYKGYKTYDLHLNFCKKEISVLIKDILNASNQFSKELNIQCNTQVINILEGLYHIMDNGYQSFFDSSSTNATRHEILSELNSLYKIIEEHFYTDVESNISQIKSIEDDVLRFRGLCFYVFSDCINADQEDLKALSHLEEWRRNTENQMIEEGASPAYIKEMKKLLFESLRTIRKKHDLPESAINWIPLKARYLSSKI